MLEERIELIIDNINVTNKTISIARDSVVYNNGVEIARNRHRQAFVPGQIEDVKQYTGWGDSEPSIIYLNSMWTQEVIDDYNAMLAALTAQEQAQQ